MIINDHQMTILNKTSSNQAIRQRENINSIMIPAFYKYYLMTNDFNFSEFPNIVSDDELSLFREAQQEKVIKLSCHYQNSIGGFSLQKGLSNMYIQQFLSWKEEIKQMGEQNESQAVQSAQISLFSSPPPKKDDEVVSKKQKKNTKIENSPYHNYQKHLNNALKTLIIVSAFKQDEEEYKQAAWSIWKRYCSIEIKTKRVLHFVFNERNQHAINDSELKTYGLLDIYRNYGQDNIKKAKNYLSKLAIDQIDEANIDGYLKTRKIKRVDGLKSYILSFRHELECGYLKRRINLEGHLM